MATTEYFDILDESGALTGRTAPRGQVHSEGLYHKAVHTWLFVPTTGELLLQKRAACKDSWPDWWDISSAGHLSAGQLSADAAVRELHEELGVLLPRERFQYLFTHLEKLSSIQKGKPFINNEFNDVYLVCLTPEERAVLRPDTAIVSDALSDGSNSRFELQRSEVSAVCYLPWRRVEAMYARTGGGAVSAAAPTNADADAGAGAAAVVNEEELRIVPCSDFASYGRLFKAIGEIAATASR